MESLQERLARIRNATAAILAPVMSGLTRQRLGAQLANPNRTRMSRGAYMARVLIGSTKAYRTPEHAAKRLIAARDKRARKAEKAFSDCAERGAGAAWARERRCRANRWFASGLLSDSMLRREARGRH